MIKILSLTFGLLCVAASPSFARLGDSPRSLKDRFGERLIEQRGPNHHEDINSAAYFTPGYLIGVDFADGASVRERYYKLSTGFPREAVQAFGGIEPNDTVWHPRYFWLLDDFRFKYPIGAPRQRLFWANAARFSLPWTNREVSWVLNANSVPCGWRPSERSLRLFLRRDGHAWAYLMPPGVDGEYLLLGTGHIHLPTAAERDRSLF
ncbi:MAG: hypothetical protein PHO89_05230 [Methylacidiphilaceae bacterium]|nr:hypothetical protein [Candidatus Methylacidiphilaceae bacterium]